MNELIEYLRVEFIELLRYFATLDACGVCCWVGIAFGFALYFAGRPVTEHDADQEEEGDENEF